MRTASKIIADLAKDTARDIKRMKDRVARVRENKESVAVAVAITNKITKGITRDDAYVSEYIDSYDGELVVTISREVESLRDDAILLTLLDRADDFDFKMESKDYVTDWLVERTFTFRRDGLRIKIEARVANPDKPEGCRRVQIGEETQVVPKFAIVCD